MQTTQVHCSVVLKGSPEDVGIQFCRDVLLPTALAIGRERGAEGVLTFMTAVLVHTGIDASVVFSKDVAARMLSAAQRAVAEQDPCDSGERH